MRGAAPVYEGHERCVFSEEAVRVVAQRVRGVPVARAALGTPGPWARGAVVREVTGFVALERELVPHSTALAALPHVFRVHTSPALVAAAAEPDGNALVLDARVFGACPVAKTNTLDAHTRRGAARDRSGAPVAVPARTAPLQSNVVLAARLVADANGTALPCVCAVATRDIPDAHTPLVVDAEAPTHPSALSHKFSLISGFIPDSAATAVDKPFPALSHCPGRDGHARIDLKFLAEALAQMHLQQLPSLKSVIASPEQQQQQQEQQKQTKPIAFTSPAKITSVRAELEALGPVRISVDEVGRYPVCYDEPIASLALVAEHDADLAPLLAKLGVLGGELVSLAVTTGVVRGTQRHAQVRCSDGMGLHAWLHALRTTLRAVALEDVACTALCDAFVPCAALQELQLVRCPLGAGGLCGLPRALLALDVSGSDWDGSGVGANELPLLEELVAVHCTHIDPARLAQSLRTRRTLRRADFAWCTHLACSAISDALAPIAAIETLSIAHCRDDHPPALFCPSPGTFPAWCATIRSLDTTGIATDNSAFADFLQHCPLLHSVVQTPRVSSTT